MLLIRWLVRRKWPNLLVNNWRSHSARLWVMNEASKSDSQKVYILRQADYNFANMFGELILFFQKKIVRPYFLLNQEGGNLWRNGFTDDAYSRQSWQIEPRLTTKQIGKNLISEEGLANLPAYYIDSKWFSWPFAIRFIVQLPPTRNTWQISGLPWWHYLEMRQMDQIRSVT